MRTFPVLTIHQIKQSWTVLIKAGFEFQKKSSHGVHGVHGGLRLTACRGTVHRSELWLLYADSCLLTLQTLAAVTGRKSTPFHGADGADALQAIGQ